jgi:hypothetical protein
VAADLVEPLVGLRVHARDEERGDRRDVLRVPAALDEPLDAADVRLGHFAVALQREDQRDVDRDAAGDRLLDRGQSRLRRRDLDVDVVALDHGVQVGRLVDRGLRVVRVVRIDLERDPPVLAVGAVPDLLEQVAGAPDVLAREREEDVLGLLLLRRLLADLVVVVVAVGDRALEDRRVGRHADDALVDQALQVTVPDEGT